MISVQRTQMHVLLMPTHLSFYNEIDRPSLIFEVYI